MKQLNLPRKTVSLVQIWASIVLIIIALAMSMSPIISFKASERENEIIDFIEKLDDEIGMDLEIPTEVNVSLPKLISLGKLVANIIGGVKDTVNDIQSENPNAEQNATDKLEEITDYLKTEQGKEDIIVASCLALTVMKGFDSEGEGLAVILNFIISLIGLLVVIILIFVLPIKLLIALIGSLMVALKNLKTPEKASADVGGRLTNMLSLPFVLMLFQCIVPGMQPASGVYSIAIICIISVLINFACTRLRNYPQNQFVYLNIAQGTAAVGVIGFLVFFFNMVKTGIFQSFIDGKFSNYMAEVALAIKLEMDINYKWVIDIVLFFLYAIFMLVIAGYLEESARRLSCAVKPDVKKGLAAKLADDRASVEDNNIAFAIVAVIIYIIPKVLAGLKHCFDDPTSTASKGEASFLNLSDAANSALNVALVGAIIMLIAEIAQLVLNKTVCPEISDEEKVALVMGNAKTMEEKVEDAKKILSEAEAIVAANAAAAPEAAVAEEAPVEESPVAEEASEE